MDNAKFVETTRILCKSRKTSLTKLEAELGFSNGYIGKWAKRPTSPPHDKLVEIANALGVPVEELTGEQKESLPAKEADRQNVIDYLRKRFSTMSEEEKAAESSDILRFLGEELKKQNK